MKKFLLSIICCLVALVAAQAQTQVTDVLTTSLLGVTSSSYTEWSGKSATSSAVYAGKTAAKSKTAIQMNSTNPYGIVSTTSGGKVAKISVVWNTNTTSGRTIDIYGKNTAYTASSELYGDGKGTKIGSIVCGTSTTLVVEGEYAYIGICSNKNALYLDEIQITWETTGGEGGGGETPETPDTPDVPDTPASVEGSVADALAAYVEGEQIDATVTGYIVGYVNSTTVGTNGKNCVFGTNAERASNILIADDAEEEDYTKCLAVQIPSTKIGDGLNLMESPGSYKKKVVIKATLEKYLGHAALKSVQADGTGIYHTVSAAGYSTLFLNFVAEIPSTAEVYTVTAASNGFVVLTQLTNAIPAQTGVILKNAGEHLFVSTTKQPTAEGNLLQGSLADTTIDDANYDYYILANGDNGVGLYRDAFSGGEFVNNAGKAYLPIAKTGAQNALSYGFDFGGTTGIEAVETAQDAAIYDLTGRKVAAMTAPGIYIVNGKKVIK